MSKMDNLRAMREARFEQAVARAKSPDRPGPAKLRPASARAATAVVPGAGPATEPEEALCGHRAISGRTCTREAGHAAKSHRYS